MSHPPLLRLSCLLASVLRRAVMQQLRQHRLLGSGQGLRYSDKVDEFSVYICYRRQNCLYFNGEPLSAKLGQSGVAR